MKNEVDNEVITLRESRDQFVWEVWCNMCSHQWHVGGYDRDGCLLAWAEHAISGHRSKAEEFKATQHEA